MSRAATVDEVGRTVVEETRRIIDYHNARVYLVEPPDDVVPIAFEGTVGRLRAGRHGAPALQARRGLHRLGRAARRAAPRQRRQRRPARARPSRARTTSTSRCSSSRCATTTRRSASSRSPSSASTSSDDDDLRLLTILADQAATAIESARLLTRTQDLAGELRRLLDMSAELSGSLDPRQVADLMAGHLGARDGRRGVRDQLLGPADGPARVARLLPGPWLAARSSRTSTCRRLPADPPRPRAQETVIIDADDPDADPAEVELLVRDGSG